MWKFVIIDRPSSSSPAIDICRRSAQLMYTLDKGVQCLDCAATRWPAAGAVESRARPGLRVVDACPTLMMMR